MTIFPASLTRGHVDQMIRLAWLVGVLCFLIGCLWLFMPMPKQPSPSDIIQASARPYSSDVLFFSSYSELSSARQTPFEFQELAVSQVQTRQREPEPPPEQTSAIQPPVTPPPPMPDTEGLMLVGTAPGGAGAVAMLLDQQTGLTMAVSPDDSVRNAVVAEIHSDKIVLAVDEQRTELILMAINGSDELNRQLSGLPPQVQVQGQGMQASSMPMAAPMRSDGNAILTGAGSPGNAGQNMVITQAAAPVESTTSQDRSESSQDSQSSQGIQDSQSSQDSQILQAPQAMSSEGSAPSSPDQEKSLGISGHMLSLTQQQELSLNQTGLMVTSVRIENSPIQPGDVVLAISGQEFTNLADAKSILNGLKGNTADIQLFRDGASFTVTAELI